MNMYDPTEPPIQFAEDDEICEHDRLINDCLECEQDKLINYYEGERKEL